MSGDLAVCYDTGSASSQHSTISGNWIFLNIFCCKFVSVWWHERNSNICSI